MQLIYCICVFVFATVVGLLVHDYLNFSFVVSDFHFAVFIYSRFAKRTLCSIVNSLCLIYIDFEHYLLI